MKLYTYLLLSLLGLLVGAFIMHVLANHPGMILLNVGNWTVEISFWFGMTLLVLANVALIGFWWLIKKCFRSFVLGMAWFKESRDKRAEKLTQQGVLHFVEEDWVAAKKSLLSSAKDTKAPLINYLVAAKSAAALGHTSEELFLLEQAEKNAKDEQGHIVLARAKILFNKGKYSESLELLESLSDVNQNTAAVLSLYRDILIKTRAWEDLIALLPRLKSTNAVTGEALSQLEENAYMSWLDDEVKGKSASIESVDKFWGSLPKAQRKSLRLIGLYANSLLQLGGGDQALKLLATTLKGQWHIGLVEIFGSIESQNKEWQLTTAESWLQKHPDESKLLYVLGRLSMRNALWGKAKDYFEKSLSLEKDVKVFAALADLYAELGDKDKQLQMSQKGLALSLQ